MACVNEPIEGILLWVQTSCLFIIYSLLFLFQCASASSLYFRIFNSIDYHLSEVFPISSHPPLNLAKQKGHLEFQVYQNFMKISLGLFCKILLVSIYESKYHGIYLYFSCHFKVDRRDLQLFM